MMPAISSTYVQHALWNYPSRALREQKDQTADGTWPRKHSVYGLVAQKRRAGVLATAGLANVARARESGLQGDAETLLTRKTAELAETYVT